MKILKTLLLMTILCIVGGRELKAQTASEYEAALDTIDSGHNYCISTDVNGTKYYVTTNGGLASSKEDAGIFICTKVTTGGAYVYDGTNTATGIRIDSGSKRFTNPPISNNVAVLNRGTFATTTDSRDSWETQVLFLNSEGKFAIRSCNTAYATNSWEDAGRTFWTWEVEDVPTPLYSYDPAYVWDFEELSTINVTYEVYDGGTKVDSITVVQEANSEVSIPPSLTGLTFRNTWRPYACYEYSASGLVGNSDCTITVTRSLKDGVVQSLTDLTNTKAYTIQCDRGSLLTKDDHLASTAHSSLTNASPGTFAIINYEDHYYLYSVADNKFVTFNSTEATAGARGPLASSPTHGTVDAIILQAKEVPYFFASFSDGDANYGLNTNGNNPYGYVINNWMTADAGNLYYMIEAADFDPTDALETLDAVFHPYMVTYVVKDVEGHTIFTSDPIPTLKNTEITSLPVEYQRAYCTYNEVEVTITEPETIVEFTATWNGPFELSDSYETAHWYDMAVRGDWYVTSDSTDADGALSTVNANALGLAEDAYQWAFVGDPYHIKIYNKAEGMTKIYGITDEVRVNQGIPSFIDRDTESYWIILQSISSIDNSFMLIAKDDSGNIYQLNQYGGAGCSLKLWKASYTDDSGSAFRVFDVPDDFSEYVVAEISPYMESEKTGLFTLTDEARADISYDPSYKSSCTFSTYKAMKQKLLAYLGDLTGFVLPTTGYYRIDNKMASKSIYNGHHTYLRNIDGTVYSHYKDDNYEGPYTIVKVEADPNDISKYALNLQGTYITVDGTSGDYVGSSEEPFFYTLSIQNPGYGVFKGQVGTADLYLHSHAVGQYNQTGHMIGYSNGTEEASQWEFFPATTFPITIGESGYTTLYVPFPVSLPEGVQAYVGKYLSTDHCLYLMDAGRVIPASTAVVLQGTAGTYEFSIADEADSIANDLKGTYVESTVTGAQTLSVLSGNTLLFSAVQTTLEANSAYLTLPVGITDASTQVSFETLEQMCANLQNYLQTLAANYDTELSSEGKASLTALVAQTQLTYAEGSFSRTYMTTQQLAAANLVKTDISTQLTALLNTNQEWLQTNLSASIYTAIENSAKALQDIADQQFTYYMIDHSADIAAAKAAMQEAIAQAEEYAEMLEHLTDELPVGKDLTPLIANHDFGIGVSNSTPIKFWEHGTFRIMDYTEPTTGTWQSAVAQAYTSSEASPENYLLQTIDLPAGNYQLEADIISNGTKGVFLVAESADKSYSIEDVAKANVVKHLVRPFDHEGGAVTIGIRIRETDDPDVCVDNFSLKVIAPLDQDDLQLLQRMQEQLAEQPNWTSPWDIDKDPWVLDGVCYTDSQVTGIFFSNHHFIGNLPTALFELPHLKTVDLTVNEFSGDLAQLLQPLIQQGKTSPITFINMGANQLTGDIAVIGQVCPQLERLYAAENYFSEASAPLPSGLRNLDLSRQVIDATAGFELKEGAMESALLQLPSILLCDELGQAPAASLSFLCQQGDWSMRLVCQDGKVSVADVSADYVGQSGDTLTVTCESGPAINSTFKLTFTFFEGDANFNGEVNVLDLQTIINRIFGSYSGALNFTAANLYEDSRINVQDVVRMVDVLLEDDDTSDVKQRRLARANINKEDTPEAFLYWRGNDLVLQTMRPVAAADLRFEGNAILSWLLPDLGFTVTGKNNHVIIYSLAGAEVPVGETVIARRTDSDATLTAAILAGSDAASVSLLLSTPTETSVGLLSSEGTWTITTADGIIMAQGTHSGEFQSTTKRLPAGVYILHTAQGQTFKFTHK